MSRPWRGGGFVRGLSGVLAGGAVALVVALLIALVVTLGIGVPRPGPGVVVRHAVAAAVAVVLQIYTDRTGGARGMLAAMGVIVVVAVELMYEWLL